MPRKPRRLTESGIYHIITRGNNRQSLFRKVEDFDYYLELIQLLKEEYLFELYHYCLMTNHTHLLIKFFDEEALQKLMQRINLTYAKYYRRQYHYHGHVFQDRFKSFPIESESYLLECGRYIERNSLKAKMVQDLKDYPYSSYCYYAYDQEGPVLTPNPLYLELSSDPSTRQLKYREYLLQSRPYEEFIAQGLMAN